MFDYFQPIFWKEDYSKIEPEIEKINKIYFSIKNNHLNDIQDIQENLNSNINIFNLIESQHNIIKVLEKILKSMYDELSFRKLIIDKKQRILKNLNEKIINKLINKCSNQEIKINLLKNEIIKTKRINNNIFPIDINNINNNNTIPLNIIAPLNTTEFKGTIAFLTPKSNKINPLFEKFINIKRINVPMNKFINKSKSVNKLINNCDNSNINSSSKSKIIHKKSASISNILFAKNNSLMNNDILNENKLLKTLPNKKISNSFSKKKVIYNNFYNISKNQIKSKPFKYTKELLGKSLDIVKNFEIKRCKYNKINNDLNKCNNEK